MDVRSRLGANVKRLREQLGLSQEQLAFDAEMHRTYISGIERGVRNPTVTVLERLAIALKTKSSDLLT
ncbi:helix-turn-helix domain-containing protein [Brevundimonas sp.]|uniref:helix-turn-helix domain-containing protein n=1 Tax=Brevundimonas sp. TaxID=1871086 RepID=UPI0035AF8700